MSVNSERILDRKLARSVVEPLIGLLQDVFSCVRSEAFVEAFWEEVRKAFPEHLAAPTASAEPFKPMGNAESQAFGQQPMPWGKWKGMAVDTVQLSYLQWMAEQPDEWKKNLQRYLASPRIQQQIEQENHG